MPLPLTKSLFVQGCRCPKLLWFAAHQPEVLESDESMLEQGIAVGELARSLYPDGILIDLNNAEAATKDALTQGKPIYEATFRYDRYLCRVDILVPNADAWDVLEVKSSTEPKPDHYSDIEFQVAVLRAAGLNIKRAFLVHINKEFRKQGPIDVEQFFQKVDVTDDIVDISEQAKHSLSIMDNKIPEISIGSQCLTENKRQHCPAKNTCWKFLPEHNVMQFYYDKKLGFKLLQRGVKAMEEVADSSLTKQEHFIQRDAAITGKPYINKKELQRFLSSWKQPLYFFDFETIAPAIPVHEAAASYQQIPFQFSLHVMQKDGNLTHHEFLSEDKEPRVSLLHALESLGDKGSIVTYNAKFERGVLVDLKEAYPEYAARIDGLLERIVDLLEPFQKFYYYHPLQRGSCSIKHVLPALTSLSYEGMVIGNGSDASSEYFRVMHIEPDAKDKELVFEALRRYCELDTMAMVEVYRVLKEAAKE